MKETFENDHPSLMKAGEGKLGVSSRIDLRKDDKIIVTDVNDIYYAEASGKVTLVYTLDGEFTMPMSISEFHAQLPQGLFFRCHRSYSLTVENP